ncbi:MAG: GDSL-type esterase/lipase family protein [Kofleriaceae bacterium]
MRIPELTAIALVTLVALVGCGSCDGDRARNVKTPVAPGSATAGSAGTARLGSAGEPALPATQAYLDAPAGTLDGLFAGLAAVDRGDAESRVAMEFFGDSHTAGDSLTSRLRISWQARFGDAGRGLVGAGKVPTRHYYQRDVRYGKQGDWHAMVGGARGDTEPFGIDGMRVTGKRKGAQLWVETCAECGTGKSVSQFEILYYAAPEHGILRYRVDDQPWQQLATKTSPIEPPHPARQVIRVEDGPHKLTLEHGGGGVLDLFGVVMERARPGVIVDSLGVVGRRLGSLRSWDWSIIGEQLATRDPKLVVLQYGTNEADDPDLVLDDLARYYDDTILRIRAAAPTASILILGPPDMGAREAGRSCDHKKPKPDQPMIPECEWRTPAILPEIISVEHAAATRNHVAFFDTFAAMGGPDHMEPWVEADPKVAYKDRVHFTDLGYQRWADALSGALLAEYAQWRAEHELPPVRPMTVPPLTLPSPGSAAPLLPGPVAP